MFEEIEKQFKDKSVAEVEKYADESKEKSLSGRMEFIKALYHLKHNSFFRGNPLFKTSTFEEYISIRHQLRPATFQNEAWAFFKFPKDATDNSLGGPGLLNKIRHSCGSEKVPGVLEAIKKIPVKTRNMEKINAVVQKFERPEIKKKKADKKARPTIKSLQSALDKAHALNQQQAVELREAYEQIEKLKAAATGYKAKYEELLKVVNPVAAMVSKTVEQRPNA